MKMCTIEGLMETGDNGTSFDFVYTGVIDCDYTCVCMCVYELSTTIK